MGRPKKTPAPTGSAVGYIRVSTGDQADSGLGLEAQRSSIAAEAERRGWTLQTIYEDAGASGKSLGNRPGLAEALHAVRSGATSTLIVAKLDRLSRSLVDFAGLMSEAQASGWNLVALDLGIDLSTPAGEFMASIMASAAQWERRIIGQRTKEALAVKRAQGVRLGRPRDLDPAVRQLIVGSHEAGRGWSAIARQLNADGVPTARGGSQWYPSTVRAVVLSSTNEREHAVVV